MIFNYAKIRTLNSAFGGNSPTFSAPAIWYVGLSTTIPLDDGTNITEPTIGVANYARVAVTNDSSHFSAATVDSLTNLLAITFNKSSASWNTQTSVLFWDAATGGHGWYWDNFSSPRLIDADTILVLDSGALTINLNNS